MIDIKILEEGKLNYAFCNTQGNVVFLYSSVERHIGYSQNKETRNVFAFHVRILKTCPIFFPSHYPTTPFSSSKLTSFVIHVKVLNMHLLFVKSTNPFDVGCF